MKRTLILLSVLGLMLGACGKDDNKTNASDDDTTATTVKDDSGSDDGDDGDEADGALKAKLLAVSDLPSGFTLESSDESDPTESTDEEDDEFCPELSELDKDYPGEREAEASFQRASGETEAEAKVVTLNEQIGRFGDEDEADDAFAAFAAGFPKCKSFTETDDDGSTTTGSFEKIDFAKVGDDTYGTTLKLKQTSEGQSFELDGYFVALREGRHIIILMTVGLGDELTKAQVEGIAKKAAAKVA